MKLVKITILLLAFVVFQLSGLGQNSKQELNDQLWEAARKGDAAAVTALLDKGADVNAKFRYGTTALFKAAERGNTEVVNVLLARGADVHVKDTFYGATAMTWALDHNMMHCGAFGKSPENTDEVLLTGARQNKLSRAHSLARAAPPGALRRRWSHRQAVITRMMKLPACLKKPAPCLLPRLTSLRFGPTPANTKVIRVERLKSISKMGNSSQFSVVNHTRLWLSISSPLSPRLSTA